ncbi:zinc ribbon domain-containing protein [Paenalkalicoccus suaedae]|uniref:Zinc ribbon domain-containing protein n=1 Tax=Paenalkalicoccus suaedae TaxID=2592382 RepID=A0A859FAW7_9BACI|nr:zinc ribbon domain-containing protein [Paenalkalicoccus suaedae]
MALISCPECDRSISDHAKACPHCGYPLRESRTPHPSVIYQEAPKERKGMGCCGCFVLLAIGIAVAIIIL